MVEVWREPPGSRAAGGLTARPYLIRYVNSARTL